MDNQRVIYIARRPVSLKAFVAAVLLAKANPDVRFDRGLDSSEPTTGCEVRRQFLRSLHDRISQAVPYTLRGKAPLTRERERRKTLYDYQAALRRDAQRLRGYGGFGRRLETPEVRRRLGADHVHFHVGGAHRLCDDRECEMRY